MQTGLTRTSQMWSWRAYGIQPDIFVATKWLGGGICPVSAAVVDETCGGWLEEDGAAHIATSGGADLGCIVTHKGLEMLRRPEVAANVRFVTEFFAEGSRISPERHSFVFDVMEPLRPVVYRAVLKLVTEETFSGSDFVLQLDGICRLNPELARRVVQEAQTSLASTGRSA